MTAPNRRTPAGRLVAAFGDVEKMASAYAPDIRWSLPVSSNFPRPMVGKEAVMAFNRRVWSEIYKADCTVEILDEAGDEAMSAVRFIYRAHANLVNQTYENEYTLFARTGPQGLTEVFEAFDTAAARDFYTAARAAAAKDGA